MTHQTKRPILGHNCGIRATDMASGSTHIFREAAKKFFNNRATKKKITFFNLEKNPKKVWTLNSRGGG